MQLILFLSPYTAEIPMYFLTITRSMILSPANFYISYDNIFNNFFIFLTIDTLY